MHEIITLQLGQRSNYLATHFWNLQESYFTYSEQEQAHINHDINFRPGIGTDGVETFTPRTVIYDLKGGFGSLRKINALYDIEDEPSTTRNLWDGSTATQQQQPVPPSRYLDLLEAGLPTFQLHDNDIRYWSDFNRVYYHPRSAIQLNDYELNSQVLPFEKWSVGEDLYQSLDKDFDLLDRDVRPFAEECDQMQGFQVLSGIDDAWGGFASRYLEDLRDEYGKTSIWLWGVEASHRAPRNTQLLQSANTARSICALSQQASALVRLSVPTENIPRFINMTSTSDWSNTALLSTAFETSTLPTRLRSMSHRTASLSLLEDMLNTNGNQKIIELQLAQSTDHNHSPAETSNSNANAQHSTRGAPTNGSEDFSFPATKLDIGFSLGTGQSHQDAKHVFAQIEIDRHAQQESQQDARPEREQQRRQMLQDETIVERFEVPLPFPVMDTFPERLFRTPHRENGLGLCAALTTRSTTRDSMLRLRNSTLRSLQLEEREILYNDLTNLANAYSFGWESGSDSDHDS